MSVYGELLLLLLLLDGDIGFLLFRSMCRPNAGLALSAAAVRRDAIAFSFASQSLSRAPGELHACLANWRVHWCARACVRACVHVRTCVNTRGEKWMCLLGNAQLLENNRKVQCVGKKGGFAVCSERLDRGLQGNEE